MVVTPDSSSTISDIGPEAQDLRCPFCHNFVTTRVIPKPTRKSRIVTLLKCLCCCWLCCPTPKCTESFKDKYHYCPDCNAFLGLYQK